MSRSSLTGVGFFWSDTKGSCLPQEKYRNLPNQSWSAVLRTSGGRGANVYTRVEWGDKDKDQLVLNFRERDEAETWEEWIDDMKAAFDARYLSMQTRS